MSRWKPAVALILALGWTANAPAQAPPPAATVSPALAPAVIQAQVHTQIPAHPVDPHTQAATAIAHPPAGVLVPPVNPPDPSPPGPLSETPDLHWADGPPAYVHGVYFSRSAWGTPLAVPPSDHPNQWFQAVWHQGPLWFVVELDGAPGQLLCLRWQGAVNQVVRDECQAMPGGRARLSFAAPYLGKGAPRTQRAELVIVPDEDSMIEEGEALATLSFGAGGDTGAVYYTISADAPLPTFPWPPPRPTSKTRIDTRMLVEPGGTLGDAANRLDAALEEARYEPPSYYAIPGGFALATRMEQIEEDGTPVEESRRWSTEVPPRKIKSLGDYLRALLSAPEGFYRVIVFTVTDQPVAPSSAKVSEADAISWGADGGDRLPEDVANQPFSRQHRCLVLVYEFQKRAGSEPTVNPDGAPSASVHLRRSGISAALQP